MTVGTSHALAFSQCKGPSVAPPSTCYDCRNIVTVKVKQGEHAEDFPMLADLLRWHSTYFAARLDQQGFGKDSQDEVEIDDNIEAFKVFQCWVYTGKLKDTVEQCQSANQDAEEDRFLSTTTLCNTWVFGDLRGIPGLKNAAIDMLHERIGTKWSTDYLMNKLDFERVTEGSELRSYVSDTYSLVKSAKVFLECDREGVSAEWLVEIMVKVMERAAEGCSPLTKKEWARLDRCRWHDHSGPGGKLRLQDRK